MMQRTELLSEECRHTAMGLRLRGAREALQISESSAAEQLFLTVGQVRALEDARYDELPAEVFVRGYLRSYARLLGLDPEDILRQYSAPGGAALSALSGSRDEKPSVEKTRAISPPMVGSRSRSAATAAGSETLGAGWERLQGLFKPGAKKLAGISDTALMVLSGLAIVLVIATVVTLLLVGGGRVSESLAPSDAQGRNLAGQALVVDPDLFEVMDDATQVKINLPSASASAGAGVGVGLARSAADAPVSGDAAGAAEGAPVLELVFSADCWVEVKDASRNILLADMRRAGDREVFTGEPPYRVLLGRADAVAVRFGGQDVPVQVDDGKDYTRVVIGD